jgi:DNA-binding SARP family transcriptional activator
MLNLFLFGSPRLERQGQVIGFDTRKAIALLAYLAVTRSSHSRDALATLLYPDSDQTRARASLRRTLSTLNAALDSNTLDIDRETIGLNPRATLSVDVIEFERIHNECGKHQHPGFDLCGTCVKRLTRAAEIYCEDFLAGFTLRDSPNFDDWQFFTTEYLRRKFAGVLEQLVGYYDHQHAYPQAIDYAHRWLALDPLHEPAHRQLMQLYAQSNQRAAALRQYHECARVLEQELGVPPLAETTHLFKLIRDNQVAQEKREQKIDDLGLPLDRPLPAEPYPLVGRTVEWQTIQQAYSNIRTEGHLIVIQGEAGIGKTRLAEEFLNTLSADTVVLRGRAYEGETNLAYGIFIEALRQLIEHKPLRDKIPTAWLGEVARLVPEIGDTPSAIFLNTPSARGRFFEGISQTIFALTRHSPPGIFFCDDLQWADSASIELLAYLVQRLRGRPLCILATWRTESSAPIESLRHLVAQAQRAQHASLITLTRLTPLAVHQLVASMVGDAAVIAQQIGTRLHAETEGLPFFIVEYLNALDRGNAAVMDWSLPNGVRDLLHARLAIASETGKQLLSAAAVIGRSFDFETLREASGRTEDETIRTIEELIAQGLIKETATETLRYDFVHEKLRALAYEETSAARRRLLHRRVAEALVNRGRARHEMETLANQMAWHYQLAEENSLAAEYFKLAGDHARTLFANAEALTHYRAALTLGHPQAATLYEAIGDMQTLLGDYPGALTSYTTASTLCEPGALARLEHKRGNVHHRRGEYAMAVSHFQMAHHTLVDSTSPADRVRLFADWSLAARALSQDTVAQELASRALTLAEMAHDLYALAQVHNILGILARHRSELRQARYHLEQSCAIAESLPDPSVRIAALNNLALVCRDTNEIARAIKLTETSLALCVTQGDRHHQAALHNNLADLLHALGKNEEALAQLEQSFAILAEMGADATAMQPEIWNLVEW